jgi:hypothetical protein
MNNLKVIFISIALTSCSVPYIDNEEYLPPVNKPMEQQVRDMFKWLEGPLIKRTPTQQDV